MEQETLLLYFECTFLYALVLMQATKHKNTVVSGHVTGHKLYMFTYSYYQQGLNNHKLR